jgi:hypothetical protein
MSAITSKARRAAAFRALRKASISLCDTAIRAAQEREQAVALLRESLSVTATTREDFKTRVREFLASVEK